MSFDKEKEVALDTHSAEVDVAVAGSDADLFIMSDEILSRKMTLVNDAIDQIGFTNYHWKLFCLNGAGYAVDSLLLILQPLCQGQISLEFNRAFPVLVTANYAGLFFGAIFWGFASDIIGRRIAFQTTLFVTSVFAIAVAGGLNYTAVCALSAVSCFAGGGNLILDGVTFLEFLPRNKQYMVTMMALWWGVGQTVTTGIAWGFIANFSCTDADNCPRASNMGWRYTYITSGIFVLLCAFARMYFIRMVESPKYDLSQGDDYKVIKTLDTIAQTAGRTNPLTLEQLQAMGTIKHNRAGRSLREKVSIAAIGDSLAYHLKGLFATKMTGYNTFLNFLSWFLIGIAYPLFYVFVPAYLKSRGADLGDGSLATTFKNNFAVNVCSIFGPVIAGFICDIPKFGRRGTLALGAILSMVFMFAYSQVKTPAQNVGFTCAVNITINIYYGTLFAYTPETMPSAHRATGYGLAVAIARAVSVISPVIGFFANVDTNAPVFIMAGFMAVIAVVSCLFPYEVRGKHSM